MCQHADSMESTQHIYLGTAVPRMAAGWVNALHADGFLWLQAQQALAQSKAPVVMPITTLALPGTSSSVTYSVRGLLRDINLEVGCTTLAMTARCA